jgi:hypothetical protein
MKQSLLILSACALLLASCGNKGGNSGLLVPKDASMVVHINSSSLSSKISWDEIRQTNWFKEMSMDNTDTTARQLLENPASSGIDAKSDFVFYMRKQGGGGYCIFTGSLTDAAAFEKLAKKMNDGGEVKKDGDYMVMAAKHDEGTLIWNKSKFAYAANATMPDMKGIFEGSGRRHNSPFERDSLKVFAIGALTLKNDDNLDTDSRFASLVKDGSDVHIWVNMAGSYNNMGGMMSMMKLNLLTEDNISAVSISFDNGKITAKSKQYYGDEMSKFLSNHKAEPVSADVINRIPSQNVVGVLAFNYPPKGLQDLLKLIGVDGMANGYLSQVNYSIEEFVKANKGEVVLAVSDFNMVSKQDTMDTGIEGKPYIHTSTEPDVKILFATAVNDKAAFEKLITIAWEASKGKTGKLPPISYKLENNWFAASNSAEQTDKFLAGGNNKFSFTDKITGHPIGAYVDLQKIIQTVGTTAPDSSSKEMIAASLSMWQDVVATGGDYKDKAIQFEFTVNLVDKNTNSLKQLNGYADKMQTIMKKKMHQYAFSNREMDEEDEPVVAPRADK